jgi:hypothetical protein
VKRAAVAEYLDNVLPGKMRGFVLPVIEPKARFERSKQTVAQIVEACLHSPDVILRECAADAVAKHRWPSVSGAPVAKRM